MNWKSVYEDLPPDNMECLVYATGERMSLTGMGLETITIISQATFSYKRGWRIPDSYGQYDIIAWSDLNNVRPTEKQLKQFLEAQSPAVCGIQDDSQ